MQTLAALNPAASNYDDIFSTMRKIKLPYLQQEQLFRRMVFNVVTKNIDDHSKNFSFLMQQNGCWSLSPAYDLTFTYSPGDFSFRNRHEFAINGKNDDITRNDLLITAGNNEIEHANRIIDEVTEVVSRWKHYAAITNISKSMTELIGENLLLL